MFDSEWTRLFKSDLEKLDRTLSVRQEPKIRFREGERRYVSIFFCDVKGFSGLALDLDPEELAEIMDLCFGMFSKIIEKYGGYVDKYEGDLIMALFGSRTASETDCERALRSGLDFLDVLHQINGMLEEREIHIDIRIGIHYGLVVTGKLGLKREGDFTAMGDAVNLAVRLEEAAPVNSLLVSEEVYQLVRNAFACEEYQPFTFKGRQEVVQSYLVKYQRTPGMRWERSALLAQSPFLGRQNELIKIENLYLLSMVRSQMLGIMAPAGVGKSRLVHEFLKRSQKGMPEYGSLSGNTLPYLRSPYFSFSVMLKRFFKLDEGQPENVRRQSLKDGLTRLDELAGGQTGLLKALPLIGFLVGLTHDDIRLEQLEPQSLQLQIQMALRDFLSTLARVSRQENGFPLIVVVEDLQWIDEASAAMLLYLADQFPENVFLIFLYRPEYSVPDNFRRNNAFTEMNLERLAPETTSRILQAMLPGVVLPETLQQEILQKADGNPFYAEELAHSLVEQGLVEQSGEEWMVTEALKKLEIPVTLRALILARVDHLAPELKVTLQRASVVGQEFLARILDRVASLSHDPNTEIGSYLQLLEQMNLIIRKVKKPEDSYFFKHLLTQEVSYSTLLNYNRRLLHRLTGESVELLFPESIDDHLSLLAFHFGRAQQVEKALDYYDKAITRAYRLNNVREGLSLCTEAIDLARDHESGNEILLELLFSLEGFLRHFGLREKQKSCLDEIGNLAEKSFPDRLPRQQAGLSTYFLDTGDLKKAGEFAELARKTWEQQENWKALGQVYRNLGVIADIQGDFEKAEKVYRLGVAAAEKANDMTSKLRHLGNIGLLRFQEGLPDEALKIYQEVEKICTSIGDIPRRARLLHQIGLVHLDKSETNRAIGYFEQSIKILTEIGFKDELSGVIGDVGLAYFEKQRYDLAEKYFLEAIEIADAVSDQRHLAMWSLNLGMVYYECGKLSDAENLVKTALKKSNDLGDLYSQVGAHCLLARLAFENGDFTEGKRQISRGTTLNRKLANVANIGYLLFEDCLLEMGMEHPEKALENIDRELKSPEKLAPSMRLEILQIMAELFRFQTSGAKQGNKVRDLVGAEKAEENPHYFELVFFAWQYFKATGSPEQTIYLQILGDILKTRMKSLPKNQEPKLFLDALFYNRSIKEAGAVK